MAKKKGKGKIEDEGWSRFDAEAAYANSIFRSALGDSERCISELERSLEFDPSYAPTILSMGSVEYQRGRNNEGRKLFFSLLALPDDTTDLSEIIDEAGSFLIEIKEYDDGFDLFDAAVARFPDVAVLHQGLGCCAGHKGLYAKAIEAAERALELDPDKQNFVNDLGWSFLQAGRLQEAKEMLEKAVSMDPADELACENLRYCKGKISRQRRKKRKA